METLKEKILYQISMLSSRPRLTWNGLWIRKNEFHSSLNLDTKSMLNMNKEDQKKYLQDLTRRRNLAHSRDMEAF